MKNKKLSKNFNARKMTVETMSECACYPSCNVYCDSTDLIYSAPIDYYIENYPASEYCMCGNLSATSYNLYYTGSCSPSV